MIKHIFFIALLFVLNNCKEDHSAIHPQEKHTEKSWRFVTAQDSSKPIQRHEAAFVGVQDKFYLLGGRGMKPVSIYDTKTRTWSQGAIPPIEMHHFQPVIYQNKIYIIGAMTGKYPTETPISHVYIYDPTTDAWSRGDEIPEERRRGSTGNVLHQGKIYISCGIKNGHIGDHKNWLDRYDPQSSVWEILADAPRARDHFQAVLAKNHIYVLAGRNSNAPEHTFSKTISQVDVYDIVQNAWKTLDEHLPTKRAGNAAILYHDEILVIGGESDTQKKAHAEVEALNIQTHIWRNLQSLQEGRHGTGVFEYNDALFIASGCGNRGGNPELSTMEKYGD